MDTTTPQGQFLFSVFGALAQYERALTKERIMAGLSAAKKRGRNGGRNLSHLVKTVMKLSDQQIGLRVLSGQGANIDTTTPAGRLIFGIFASLADFESELIRERTKAGLIAARARGRNGGRKFQLTKSTC